MENSLPWRVLYFLYLGVAVVCGACDPRRLFDCVEDYLPIARALQADLPGNPIFNSTEYTRYCRLYRNIRSCAFSLGEGCNETVVTLKPYILLEDTMGRMCSVPQTEMRQYLMCLSTHLPALEKCRANYTRAMPSAEFDVKLKCRISNEYLSCLFSQTSSRCGLYIADLVFRVMRAVEDYRLLTDYCNFTPPTLPPTTSVPEGGTGTEGRSVKEAGVSRRVTNAAEPGLPGTIGVIISIVGFVLTTSL